MLTTKSSKVRRVGQDTFPFVEKPNMSELPNQPAFFHSNNRQQQQQQGRIPNNNNNRRSGYQNSNSHPYNTRGRPHHPRNSNNNNNSGRGGRGKYQQDLDNPSL